MSLLLYPILMILGYLIGSFSTGITISALHGVDIRQQGSKSSGATNVLRVLGAKSGLLTFVGDIIKSALAILVGFLIMGFDGAMLCGLACVLGHNWPVYYQMKGGKGVVCSLTVLVLLFPLEGIIACIVALIVIGITRFVSLGSLMLLMTGAILIIMNRSFWPAGALALFLFLLGIYQHRANIVRLVQGKESKIQFKKR